MERLRFGFPRENREHYTQTRLDAGSRKPGFIESLLRCNLPERRFRTTSRSWQRARSLKRVKRKCGDWH
jgi:hypothetical protein